MADALIAATALEYSLTVLTANAKHFAIIRWVEYGTVCAMIANHRQQPVGRTSMNVMHHVKKMAYGGIRCAIPPYAG